MTVAIFLAMVIVIMVTSFFSYTYGRDNARAELALKLSRSRIAHIDALKRVHDQVLILAKVSTGPAQMRDGLHEFILSEMNRSK